MSANSAGALGRERAQDQQLVWRFDSDPPAPISPKALQVMPVHGDWLADWIAERHYLGYSPPGARLRLAVWHGSRLVGGMLWGRPAARKLDQVRLLELSRMFMEDACPRNSESRVLAVAARIIRKQFIQVTTLIAYSDPAYGHQGAIYKAAGWHLDGTTNPRPWVRSEGERRRNASVGPKLRRPQAPLVTTHSGVRQMLQLPTGYLTVTQPRHRPARVEGDELEAGQVSLIDRLYDRTLGKRSDKPQLILILGVILPAILILIVRNIH